MTKATWSGGVHGRCKALSTLKGRLTYFFENMRKKFTIKH